MQFTLKRVRKKNAYASRSVHVCGQVRAVIVWGEGMGEMIRQTLCEFSVLVCNFF